MARLFSRGWALSVALAAACQGVGDGGAVPQSGPMVLGADGESVFVTDSDNGALARVNTSTGAVQRVLVGREPVRAARVGDTLYVTLRNERAIAIVHVAADGTMTLTGTLPVGTEPYGIVASPDGTMLYVACSTEGVVLEIDISTLTVTRRFAVDGEPRWLTINPQGTALFVASARAGLFRIDLREGEVREMPLPAQDRGVPDLTGETQGEVVPLTPRVTGDPVIDPKGETLAVPVLYVDNTTSAGSADPLGDDAGGGGISDVPTSSQGGYAGGSSESISRFNPGVLAIELDASGLPTTTSTVQLVTGQSAVHGVVPEPNIDALAGGFDSAEPAFDPAGQSTVQQVRGYITSLAFSPNGHYIAATLEGNRTIAMVPAHPVAGGIPNQKNDDIFFGSGGFEVSARVMIGVEDGPTGVLFVDDDTAVGWSFMSRSLSRINAGLVDQAFDALVSGDSFMQQVTWTAESPWKLEPSILPPDVLEGRRLFYSATESSMSTAGAGVTCSTCHFEGRNDGLTWTFDEGVRQTPSLAGPVSQTAPVTWTNVVASTAREAEITSQGRMGGQGITSGQKADIAAYIDWSRDVDVPLRGSTDAAVARGKELFESPATACSTCHSGPRYTDNDLHDMVDLVGVNTPGLVGLAVTAPYLHDGRAATLADLVDIADEVGMGSTASLTVDQRADLVAYLESL